MGDDKVTFDISKMPQWALAFAAVIIAVSVAYGIFFATCTTHLFGLSFGKNKPCTGADSELTLVVEQLRLDNAELVNEIRELGTRDRNLVQLTITNRGGGDVDGCPEGTFVSGIQAPGGVGGKYATDGINKITYKCSPLVAN